MEPQECLQLLKPLYGLFKSSDMGHKTFDDHHRQDFQMKPFRTDPDLWKLSEDVKLVSLSGSYVDEMIRTGTKELHGKFRITHENFEMKKDENVPFTFSDFQVSRDNLKVLKMDQKKYLDSFNPLPIDEKFSKLHSGRIKLVWLSHTRPDVQY